MALRARVIKHVGCADTYLLLLRCIAHDFSLWFDRSANHRSYPRSIGHYRWCPCIPCGFIGFAFYFPISILTLWHHNRSLAPLSLLSWEDVFDWLNGDGTEGRPLCRCVCDLSHFSSSLRMRGMISSSSSLIWACMYLQGLLAIFKVAGSPSTWSIDVQREPFFVDTVINNGFACSCNVVSFSPL